MERKTGFEPVPTGWKPGMLPLNTTSAHGTGGGIRTLDHGFGDRCFRPTKLHPCNSRWD